MIRCEEFFDVLFPVYLQWLTENGNKTAARHAKIIRAAIHASGDTTLSSRERVLQVSTEACCDRRTVQTTLTDRLPKIRDFCASIVKAVLESEPDADGGGRTTHSAAEKQIIRTLLQGESDSVRKVALAYYESSNSTTLTAIAQQLGVDVAYVSRILKEKAYPLAKLARTILQLLPDREGVRG
ncbi:MAG: hypothetical protein AAF488_00230 [Planctomycetota bacterium]